ncbi:N-acetylmuramoyl-L-alanine amidase [Sulfurimonas sp.]|jgi:N-acetylmuramoyl-L-alanine amidase|uniref:N-acetylmuramoyl-L-alanine amidase family protein n=1 Tax=Sulfurimonas sp. TaxID=2022749 RepID=UPI0025EDA6AA|nr:N-acetylmuramoyl-L-alanine amidase [Sulfurimonas sp.]MBT5935499.1 N-acetylmuramoyl-L-alanine amidase [Sulfurimonas sp.]
MFRLFVTLLVFTLSLHAIGDKELLSRAHSFLKSKSKTNQFRAYNDYKNLYLRALMSEDKTLRVSSLKGIVRSGVKLHIDVTQYSTELNKIEPTPPKIVKKSKNLKIKSTHKLKSVRWNDGKLVLLFDKKLRNNQLNYFTSYDKNTKKNKYIFDIHASMLTRSQNLRKDDVERIKLAQFNPNTLRLVIQDSAKLKISFKKDNLSLIVKITAPKSSLKRSVAPENIPPQRLDRNKVIVIDAGHGGKDPGAVGYKKYREKVIVLSIAQRLKKVLVARGFKVFMTRDSDKFIKLSNRTKFANRKNADLFISIHANAVGKKIAKQVHGIECFFLAKSRSARAKIVAAKENSSDLSEMDIYGKQSFLNTLNSHNIVASNKLAIDLQRGALASLCKTYSKVKDAGVREGPFWVLVGAQMPAVLVEVGFITHPREATRLVSLKYQNKMAQGLANGVERYFLNN